MRFLFSTGSLYTYSLDRCFHLAAQAGFDGMEVMVDTRWDSRDPDYLRRLVDRYGIPVLAVHSPFLHFARGWAQDEPDCIRKSVALAEAVGAEVVIHHLPLRVSYVMVQLGRKRFPLPNPWARENREYQRWLLEEYPALQASTEVALCIENLPGFPAYGRRWDIAYWNATRPETLDAITRFPHITMDTTHLATWGLDPLEVYPRWRERVRHVHLSNFDGREHRRPEDGQLALDRLLQRMAQDGYSHTVALELHPDALSAGEPEAVVGQLLADSLAHCRRWAGQAQPAPR